MFRVLSLLILILALSACASPAALATPTPTLTPTPIPTATPTSTPTPTPTQTPLPHPSAFDSAFASGLIRFDQAHGQWLVTATRTVDGERQTVELTLLPNTFATHDELRAKNPLAPYTVRALDENGQEVTLIWTGKEFRLAYTFPALFEGIGTEAPRLIEENLDAVPFIPIEDIQNGLAVQSLLVHIQDRLNSGETLADVLYMDPEATRNSWQKYGGNSLFFELRNDGKYVLLKAKGNDQDYEKTLDYDNMTMKILPFNINVQINGETHLAFYIANFDPQDPSNPEPTELSNWKFFIAIPANEFVFWENSFDKKNPLVPYILLYGDETYQKNHPLLAQLLAIEGNDLINNQNTYFPAILVAVNQNYNWGPKNSIVEWVLYGEGSQLPYIIQQMIFLFEVGVAQ